MKAETTPSTKVTSPTVEKTEEEKNALFGTRFLARYLGHGFQSLSKRDMESLIFYELEFTGLVDAYQSNYDLARSLRITPQRAVALRREAYARWGDARDHRQLLLSRMRSFFSDETLLTTLSIAQKSHLKEGLIPVLVEHPVAQAMLLDAIKKRRGIPRFAQNREVLLIPFPLLMVIMEDCELGTISDKSIAKVLSALRKDKTLKDLLKKDLKKVSQADLRDALNDTFADVLTKAALSALPAALSSLVHLLLKR